MPEDKTRTAVAPGPANVAGPRVKWDDSQMTTSYANVCNVASTREEVSLLFGTNQTGLNDREVSVSLSDRIILSPLGAKRLAMLINNVMDQYETRFGSLGIDVPEGSSKH